MTTWKPEVYATRRRLPMWIDWHTAVSFSVLIWIVVVLGLVLAVGD